MDRERCGICAPPRRRAVAFSPTSQLYLLPRRNEDASTTWYDGLDNRRFRRQIFRDACRMAVEVEALSLDASVDPQSLYHCIGIEEFVTRGLARHLERVRRAHYDAVFAEQTRQRRRGICDMEKLAAASERQSRWPKERSRMLATGYSTLLKD